MKTPNKSAISAGMMKSFKVVCCVETTFFAMRHTAPNRPTPISPWCESDAGIQTHGHHATQTIQFAVRRF